MKFLIISAFVMISGLKVHAGDVNAQFKSVKCPSPSVIAKSYLEIEAGGFRVGSKCVDEKKYPFLSLGRAPHGPAEGVPAKTETSADSRPFTIGKITKSGAAHYTVQFVAHLQSGTTLEDTLEFDTLQGPMKNRLGCALISVQPQHLAIRGPCKH